jgi:hypothetical protein
MKALSDLVPKSYFIIILYHIVPYMYVRSEYLTTKEEQTLFINMTRKESDEVPA